MNIFTFLFIIISLRYEIQIIVTNKSAISGPTIIAHGTRHINSNKKLSVVIIGFLSIKFFGIYKLFNAIYQFKKEKFYNFKNI